MRFSALRCFPSRILSFYPNYDVYIAPGDTFSLEATVEPIEAVQTVTWESSDPSVCTVSSAGKIKALKEGWAFITVRSALNTDAYITCNVYVVSSDSDGQYVSDFITLKPGKTFSMLGMLPLVGATAPDEVYWQSDDSFVATVDSMGEVQAQGYGMAVISVTHKETGVFADCVVKVEIGESARPSGGESGGAALVDLPEIMLDVPFIKQNKVAPTGCESASTTMLLQHYGFDISLYEFIENKLDVRPYPEYVDGVRRGCNPWVAFPGNPKSSQGYGCYAPAIVLALQKMENIESFTITYGYSVKKSSKEEYTSMEGADFVDTSNMTVADLCIEYLANNTPVVFWGGGVRRHEHVMYAPTKGTSWYIDDTDEMFTWTAYEHCLVLVGCDSSYYYFNDPLKSKQYKYARASVEESFKAVYSQFVALTPVD